MSKDLRVVNARYEEANPPLNALLLHLLSGKKAKFAPNKGFTGVELRFSNGFFERFLCISHLQRSVKW